jgi:hypothetical protein
MVTAVMILPVTVISLKLQLPEGWSLTRQITGTPEE